MRWLGRVGVVAVVSAVVAGGVFLWGRLDPGPVAAWTTLWAGVVGLVGLAVSVATSGVQAVAGYRRRLAARPDVAGQVKHLVKGRVPWAGEIDVTGLGAKAPIGEGQTLYVARDVDGRVDELVAAGGMVVLAGPAAAGKSRLAAEAVHRLASRSRRRLLVPVGSGSLRALHTAGYRFTNTVVVLDDLEHFLTDGGLDTALLAGICAGPSTVVVATIRANVLARLEEGLDGGLEGRSGLALYRPGVELLKDLRGQDRIIGVASGLSPGESKRAEAMEGDGRIERAVASEAGFGEYLIAGPAQMTRWTRDTGEVLEAVGRAVISAAVDARRAGFDDPLPGHVLDLLTPAYLPPKYRQRATTPAPAAGRDWAVEIITGTTASSCLTPHPGDTYTAADYLTDRADQPPSPLNGQPVPDTTWTILQTHATPEQANTIGVTAYLRHHRPDIALTALTHAAQTPEATPAAMGDLGVLLAERGDLGEAEAWYRRAIDGGHTGAMNNLGNLLKQRGDLGEGEVWYRRAIDAGNTGAMFNLGILLAERGDLGEAEAWYRRSSDAGNTDAVANLGFLLAERGDLSEAEAWYRRAIDAGNTGAMFNLGILLAERGDLDEAEVWFRHASDAGDTDAMVNLGNLLKQRGDLDEAEAWYRRPSDAGNTDAMVNLGNLLKQRGDLDEAEAWYRRSIDAGNASAMNNLGVLLAERGDLDEAEAWYRRASDAGHTGAMNNLGLLLAERGDPSEAEVWYQRGADAGNTNAMGNLGVLLVARGDLGEAEAWYRRASDAGHTGAMNNLGNLLKERGDLDEARVWFEKAREAGGS